MDVLYVCSSSSKQWGIKEVAVPIMHRYPPFGLLICTLISENQGLEKLRSDSNLISGLAHLDFFQVYGINLAFFSVRPRKKSRFAGLEIFLWFEADLDLSRT